jgi:hypothetical protein
MSRLYYPPTKTGQLAGGKSSPVDLGDAATKIGKLIPAELITAYAALVSASMMIKFESARLPVFWICFFICLGLTPLYLYKAADPGKPHRYHLIVSTIAFPIWAYLVSGNQVIPQWYDAGLATVIAIVFSLGTAFIPMNK